MPSSTARAEGKQRHVYGLEDRLTNHPFDDTATDAQRTIQPQSLLAVETHRNIQVDPTPAICSCLTCPAFDLNLCSGENKKAGLEPSWHLDPTTLPSSIHTIPARRTIYHPKEWSEFVPVICTGWATSAVALADGNRQILSFLLPGDLVSTASIFEAMLGRSVESVTEVTYRKFKRSDIRTNLLVRPDLLDKLAKIWIEERAQADQLALDLGRRTANERIARLLLYLADKLTKRAMKCGPTMEFPLRQRHIADATGLTPVHVSKVLGDFQRAGLIETGGRTLTIIEEMELRRIAEWQ